MSAGITSLGNTADAVTGDLQAFAANKGVNVLYKAFALCIVLLVFGTIPATSKFAGWATWAILLILLVQKGS